MAQIIFYTCQLSRARTAPPAFAAVFMKSWACFTDWNHRSYRPLTFLSSALRLTFARYWMLAVSGTFTKRTSGHCLERRTVLYSLTILSSVSKSPLH
ncbi:Phosphoribosylaminoimidazole-succinocarboxamide synthase [Trichinella spiralis]|uniref:Phosphoribosylaminoimidazole-succinocarboxamide synthase n=1 Tax=Trichinella spiralis TaxID=6334 RepID=A0ABR3KKD6_TRISP